MAKTKPKKPVSAKPQPKASSKTKAPAKPVKAEAKASSKTSKDLKPQGKVKSGPMSAAKPSALSKSADTNKKAKNQKKDPKAKTQELDLFDDGDVSESEELLEYQAELEISEEVDVEIEVDKDEGAEVTAPANASEGDEEIVLTDADGNRYCRAKDCDQAAMVDSYCRYHYLLLWKRIQIRKDILIDGKLEKYVEDLTSRYPDKFLEVLRKDLRSTKDFMAAIAELEIDESAGENEFEEDAQTFIDEVRGLSDAASSSMEDDEF